jgi:hypothetical protein
MWTRFTSHLYVRIWLAVVATVVVLTFLVGAAWRLHTDPPLLPIREVLVHNAAGDAPSATAQTPARQSVVDAATVWFWLDAGAGRLGRGTRCVSGHAAPDAAP